MFTYIFTYIIFFFNNLFIFLLLTLIIASITLMERKLLSLTQRRVGPNYIGYKGRFQFIADALKLLLKHIFILKGSNKFLFILLPCLVLIICYLFWINLLWGPNISICEIEFNLLLMNSFSILFSIFLFLTGWSTLNKYAILSSFRILILSLNLEILLTLFIIFLLILSNSFSFFSIISVQAGISTNIFTLLPILPILIVVFLLETNRIPFDLGEAESELIAGYTTELGGFFFALFYLGEYFHLFCFSFVYTVVLLGGW